MTNDLALVYFNPIPLSSSIHTQTPLTLTERTTIIKSETFIILPISKRSSNINLETA